MAARAPSRLPLRTTGSTCLHPLSELLDIPLDQVNFVVCQLFALCSAFWFRIYLHPGKASSEVRHALDTILGIYFVVFYFGWYSTHLFVLVLMCYGVMVTASVSNIHSYGPFEDQNEEDQLEKNAIIYFLDLWIERCTDEFCQNLVMPKINHLMEYVKLHMPSSHLLTRVEELMTKVEEQKSMKATPKEEEVADLEPSSASASASDHQGELEPQEDAVVPEIVEPTLLVAQPTPLPHTVSEKDVPTAADAQPPPDVAADAPPPGQALLPVLVGH